MNEHEVYPNAPIVVATMEARHPAAPPLSARERQAVKAAMSQWAPIQRSSKQVSVSAVIGPNAPASSMSEEEEFPQYFSRDSMLAVAFKKEAVVVEATRYDGWKAFLEVIQAALTIRGNVGSVDACERVGVRFINEIRPGTSLNLNWAEWVDPAILCPTNLSEAVDLPVGQWQGMAVFGPQDGRSLVLRFAPGQQVLEMGNSLVRRRPEEGPFLLVDIDSFWTHGGTIPEFDPVDISQKCDELHAPIRSLFERLVTAKLRDEVLRRG